MPGKRKPLPAPSATARPPRLHPNGLYFLDTARRALRMTRESMREEIAAGRLRAVVCAKRYYIRGQWILDWLDKLPAAGGKALDPGLSPALRQAMGAASRLDGAERAALREWLEGRTGAGE